MSNFRASLFMEITFVIGVGSASNINSVIRSPVWRFGDSRTIDKYFQANSVRKLQLGAGGNARAGWLNSDIDPIKGEIYLDAASRYPFADGSFHYIFAEHVIEHISWEAGVRMLQECYRVLAKGGKIRIITPDLSRFLTLLSGQIDVEARQFLSAKSRAEAVPMTAVQNAYVFNREFSEYGHKFLYDPPTLQKTFELAGFKEIRYRKVTDDTDPVFRQAELRTYHPLEDVRIMNNWEAMAFEATR
jgi:predicted SAM-dependent methyltransferase